MKCRNCGINYDDEEKECPMCGTKTGKGTRIAASRYTNYSHTVHSPDTCTHETYTKEQDFTHPRTPSGGGRKTVRSGAREKKKSGTTWIAVVAILVIAFAPTLLGLAGNIFTDVRQRVESGIGRAVPESSAPDAPLDYPALGGMWQIMSPTGWTELQLRGDDTYTLLDNNEDWSYSETGSFTVRESTAAEREPFAAQYPAEQFDSYDVMLVPYETSISQTADELPAGLELAVQDPTEDSDGAVPATFRNQTTGGAPAWVELTARRLVLLHEKNGDGNTLYAVSPDETCPPSLSAAPVQMRNAA